MIPESKVRAANPPMAPPAISPTREDEDADLSLAPVCTAPAPAPLSDDDELDEDTGSELQPDGEGHCKHDSSLELRTLNAFEVTLSVSIHA